MKQNILFFCPNDVKATAGGIERVTDRLARLLIRDGYNVVFMAANRRLDMDYTSVAPQYFTRDDNNKQWILEIIHRHDISLVINQMGFFSYCRKSSLPTSVKVITVMHDSYYAMYQRLQLKFLRKWNWKRVITKSMRSIYDQSDKIVLFVPPFKDEYRFFCPCAKDDKFAVIPNFNSYETPQPVPKENRLVWVGRHSEWPKRTTDMLRIWSKLEPEFPEWSIDILGDGPDGDGVRALHKKLNLKRCHLRGEKDPTPYYERASVVCMTSAFESFGMVLTEGMQHGCVPVAYDSYTAVRYIIHDGKDGVLVTPFDTDEYANKLARMMADDQKRKRMSAAARESVRQFDAEKVFLQWIDLIESVR